MKSDYLFFHTSETAGNEVDAYTATASFNTVAMNLSDFNGPWTVSVSRSATDGTPTFTIQCSFDGSAWFDYNADSTDITPPDIVIDSEFIPRYMRVKYTATGSPTGTITMKMSR